MMELFEQESNIELLKNKRPEQGRGISYEEFCRLLDRDEIFLDYFNKYCCLPGFGQTVYYDVKQSDFSVFPNFRTSRCRKTGRFQSGRILGPRPFQ